MPTIEDSLKHLPIFEQGLFDEAVNLFQRLAPDTFCQFAIKLLNGPSPESRFAASAGVRALSNSELLYACHSEGVMATSLFYLVALCEGLLMPHLQALVALSDQEGYRGPVTSTKKYPFLEQARRNFGPAIKFLATEATPLFAGTPTLHARLTAYYQDELAKLRNSVAHFKFRFETSNTKIEDELARAALPAPAHLANPILLLLRKSLRIRGQPDGHFANPKESGIRYSENLDSLVTRECRLRTFEELRELVRNVERCSFMLAFGFTAAGAKLQQAGVIKLGECGECKEVTVVAPVGIVEINCPGCGSPGGFYY